MNYQHRSEFFRSDIEGLRAVAILLVLAAHFALPGMTAGFIGVDIFFVISGYLITSILLREYESRGRITLSTFYANRLRRLLPALATMLIFSSVAAYLVIPSTQLTPQASAAASAAFWISNIFFTFSDTNYFAGENSTNAFLHTWSLGVEEQFYLLWPLLILISMGTLKNHAQRDRNLAIFFAIIAATSAVLCLVLIERWPTFSFYMMPTRAWQFAFGALTCVTTKNNKLRTATSNLMGMAGVFLLALGLFLISPTSSYPGYLAALPTLATCAWLWSGSLNGGMTHRILSLAPMQWIGRMSYAWYLWHWPIIIIGEYLIPIRGEYANTIFAMGLSLLLAIATHHLVEQPIRFGKLKHIPAKWQITAATFAMILMNSQLIRWSTINEQNMDGMNTNKYVAASHDIPFFYHDGCDDWYLSDTLKPCIYGHDSAKKKAVLLGDSIGAQWFPTLTSMFDPAEWKIIVLTKSSCPIVDESFFYQRIGREYTECSSWRDKAINWIKDENVDMLFIGTVASNPFSDDEWTGGTLRILEKLTDVPAIYLIESSPALGFHGPDCLLKNQSKSLHDCNGRAEGSSYAHVAEILEKATLQRPNAYWLETASYVCPNGICSAERDGIVIFRDGQHLTATFTASAAPHFMQQIDGSQVVQRYESATKTQAHTDHHP